MRDGPGVWARLNRFPISPLYRDLRPATLTLGKKYVRDRGKEKKDLAKLDTFIADVERKQKNVVWPDPLVNSRGVDQFFWRGCPNPTVVQRIGA